ncbi:hypothetical protein AB4Y45_32405 [Paraburkholderia sp. EG287A]|uniref:hypothetical protein n=1 Tax=Paraburkholderia sp. EG287A TaxID=3237012 RepID=UPI0034D1E996
MNRELLLIPSIAGHGEYDLNALAPEGMHADVARLRVNEEIRRAVQWQQENFVPDDDALRETIQENLTKEGFLFLKVTTTHYWDERPA